MKRRLKTNRSIPLGCGGQTPTSSPEAHSRTAAGPSDMELAQGQPEPKQKKHLHQRHENRMKKEK